MEDNGKSIRILSSLSLVKHRPQAKTKYQISLLPPCDWEVPHYPPPTSSCQMCPIFTCPHSAGCCSMLCPYVTNIEWDPPWLLFLLMIILSTSVSLCFFIFFLFFPGRTSLLFCSSGLRILLTESQSSQVEQTETGPLQGALQVYVIAAVFCFFLFFFVAVSPITDSSEAASTVWGPQ